MTTIDAKRKAKLLKICVVRHWPRHKKVQHPSCALSPPCTKADPLVTYTYTYTYTNTCLTLTYTYTCTHFQKKTHTKIHVKGLSQTLIPCRSWYQWCWGRIRRRKNKCFTSPSAPSGHQNPHFQGILAAQRWTWVIGHVCRGIYRFLNCEIAWLSLCFILETSWVALFSVCECVRHR